MWVKLDRDQTARLNERGMNATPDEVFMPNLVAEIRFSTYTILEWMGKLTQLQEGFDH